MRREGVLSLFAVSRTSPALLHDRHMLALLDARVTPEMRCAKLGGVGFGLCPLSFEL